MADLARLLSQKYDTNENRRNIDAFRNWLLEAGGKSREINTDWRQFKTGTVFFFIHNPCESPSSLRVIYKSLKKYHRSRIVSRRRTSNERKRFNSPSFAPTARKFAIIISLNFVVSRAFSMYEHL